MNKKKVDIFATSGAITIIFRIEGRDTVQEAIRRFEALLACPPDFVITKIDILPEQND